MVLPASRTGRNEELTHRSHQLGLRVDKLFQHSGSVPNERKNNFFADNVISKQNVFTFRAPWGRIPWPTADGGMDSMTAWANSSLLFSALLKPFRLSGRRCSFHGKWTVALLHRESIIAWAAIQSSRTWREIWSFSARSRMASWIPLPIPWSLARSSWYKAVNFATSSSSSPTNVRFSSRYCVLRLSFKWSV